jgi:hypothetical protein
MPDPTSPLPSPPPPPPDEADAPEPAHMLEPHAPGTPIHTWTDFLVHIGAIAVGLLLALGLEQTAELIHHRHLRAEIETRIQAALQADLKIDADNFAQLRRHLAYLAELRNAVTARINGATSPSQPALHDPRIALFVIFPGMAPYEAAQSNGTVALLEENRIRLYNRLSFARQVMLIARDHWFVDAVRLESFQRRFTDSSGFMAMNATTSATDITTLSSTELIEYRERIADLIAATEELRARMDLFDLEARSLLNGAVSETQLLDESLKARPLGFGVPGEASPGT